MKKRERTNTSKVLNVKGITLIALVVTIVVLLILASVSITVVFGDNGILQLAKEAGEKTNEAVQKDLQDIQNLEDTIGDIVNNGWSISKVTAVTSADGEIVPVPKGFVGSKATGENTVSGGFVIYEGAGAVTDANVAKAREERNQFVWVPVDGESLKYEQDKTTWSDKTYYYAESDPGWTDVESTEEQQIVKRAESVEKYGGFYVGRYEAGVDGSTEYGSATNYKTTANATTRNISEGKPVTKKGRQAWNYVSQTNAKILSENMYKTSTSVTSRLIDSYAWDTICTWISKEDVKSVTASTDWGNYYDASYNIKGLYAIHTYDGGWKPAEKYSMTTDEKSINIPKDKNTQRYEVATGVTVVDANGKEIDRNRAKNIYDFAGNMWEWTTETEEHTTAHGPTDYSKNGGTYAVLRGGGFDDNGNGVPAAERHGGGTVVLYDIHIGFRPVLYIL